MILNTEESNDRLSSPNNLINKLRELSKPREKSQSVELFTGKLSDLNPSRIPGLPNEQAVKSTLDEIEEEFKDGLIKNTAKQVLESSLVHLSNNLRNVDKTTDYARIATDMSKIVSNLEAAKREAPTINNQTIIYRPIVNNESFYQSVHVSE